MTQRTATSAATYFVAVPSCEDSHGVYGIGHTADQALDEAWQGLNRPADSGFKALPATERLCLHFERNSPDASFRPVTNASGQQDIYVDADILARIVAEVEAGFEGCTAQDEWTAETALEDAIDYVDTYVVDDETVDEELRAALDDPTMRVATDLAVRDLILATIAELAA
ncbi:hypothetical protein [uncultured Methylobacterium sp.]|jgi:hypothetical protein|uniref:hypothetical protein n=1 Tax=uncultured Methylobacterium sp. TaxID=157278 RepID=UPI002633393E|nr:hypothetical protein [uncultured Methylobacterium sp.]